MWRRPDGRALVATVDFFTPIVDDPRTWGRIAAANAASDVYAMGGIPLFALNVAAWPREKLSLDVLGEVLAGGGEVAREGGWIVAGGHTVDGAEPMYGQAVVGEVGEGELLTNAGGRPGDVLILTKPIGTGIIATAVKGLDASAVEGGGEIAEPYAAAVASMTRLNDEAARVAREAGATAATDITGFGFLGHLHQLALASGVSAETSADAVPVLPGAGELLDRGFVPGGTRRNLGYLRDHLETGRDERAVTLLADAQTSGGLLIACPAEVADRVVTDLQGSAHAAAIVAELSEGEPGRIHLR